MARERKQPEPEQQAGAPEWMVTFSDCMTLLLTFFVLLLSFSSFDDQDDFRKMSSSFANQFSFGQQGASEDDAVSVSPIIEEEIQWGSEKPTLSDKKEDLFKRQTDPTDFLRFKTFLIASEEVFWGNGSIISRYGENILTDLALFLKEFPDYFVIISESGPDSPKTTGDVGFDRAWHVFDFLATQQGIAKEQLCIATAGTVAKEYHRNHNHEQDAADAGRILEIVILKRSR